MYDIGTMDGPELLFDAPVSHSGIRELSFDEIENVSGALFPIVLFGGAIVITKGAAIGIAAAAGVVAAGTVALGVYNGYQETVTDPG